MDWAMTLERKAEVADSGQDETRLIPVEAKERR